MELLDLEVHPTVVAKGYRMAAKKAQEILNGFSEKVSEKQPVDYVNPFIGTQPSGERKSTDGRTHPGACLPFGMTKWTPANIDNVSDPYKYVEGSGTMRLYPGLIIKEEVFSFRGSHYPNGSHMRDYGSFDFMLGHLKDKAALNIRLSDSSSG